MLNSMYLVFNIFDIYIGDTKNIELGRSLSPVHLPHYHDNDNTIVLPLYYCYKFRYILNSMFFIHLVFTLVMLEYRTREAIVSCAFAP